MRILDRMILIEFVKNLLVALFALTIVFFFAEYLRGVWDEEVPALVLLKYNTLLLPAIFSQMLPPAAMMSTMVTLSLMNRKNELTAIHASGVGLGHISFLIFGAIFIFCCLTLVVQDRIIPPLAYKRTVYYWQVIKKRTDFTLDIKTSKIWYRSKNFIYNLKLYDKSTSTIKGIGVFYFNDDFILQQHIEAQTARYDEDKGIWDLRDGMLTVFPGRNQFPLSKPFKEKKLNLPETPKDFLEIEKQVDTLRLRELLGFISRNKEAGLDTKSYEVDFHSRIAISFVALVMGLLAIPYCVKPKRQGGIGKDIAICAGWIFAYWLSFSISLSLGRSGVLVPSLAVWTIPTLFLALSCFLVFRVRST